MSDRFEHLRAAEKYITKLEAENKDQQNAISEMANGAVKQAENMDHLGGLINSIADHLGVAFENVTERITKLEAERDRLREDIIALEQDLAAALEDTYDSQPSPPWPKKEDTHE